jgi:hypothetical protein
VPDVLWLHSDAAAWAAKRATTAIPIVVGAVRWQPHRAGTPGHRGVGEAS